MSSLKYQAGTSLLVAMMCLCPTQAMEIRQFDKMADQDQSTYIGDLIVGAERVLTEKGRPELAAQVKHLFTTRAGGDADTIGMVELERNLALVRADDAKNAVEHPNDPRNHVEDAMAVTLENNGIKLPDSFFTLLSNFKPKFPGKSN